MQGTPCELRVLNEKRIIIEFKEMNENPCFIKLGQKKLLFQTGFTLSLPDPAGWSVPVRKHGPEKGRGSCTL